MERDGERHGLFRHKQVNTLTLAGVQNYRYHPYKKNSPAHLLVCYASPSSSQSNSLMMLAIARTACQNHAYRICCLVFPQHMPSPRDCFEGRKWSVSGAEMVSFRGQNDHLGGSSPAEGGRSSELPPLRHASRLRKTMNFRELQEELTPGKAGRKHCGQPWIGCRRRLSASAFHHIRATAPFVLIHSTLPRDERAIRPHPFPHEENNVSTRGK